VNRPERRIAPPGIRLCRVTQAIGRTLVLWTTDSCTIGLICSSRSVSIIDSVCASSKGGLQVQCQLSSNRPGGQNSQASPRFAPRINEIPTTRRRPLLSSHPSAPRPPSEKSMESKKKKGAPSSSSSSFSWMRNPKEKKCPADSSPHTSRGIKCGVSDLQREGLRHIPVLMLVDLSFHTAFGHNLSVRAVRTGRDQNCYLPLRAPISRPKRTVSILVDVRRHRRIE
jgi:hypothetical protein